MADLEFKHHVAEIPRGEQLPETFKRTERAQTSHVPDVQEATNRFAASTNWMSNVGSAIATASSNKIAIKLGSQLGKNPQGDLGVSLTEFDQQLEKSYAAQASSTLGIQAQKLITQSNLELAKQPRISADMIAKSQQQVTQGLEKIYSLAPDSIKASMEQQYTGAMLSQSEHLVTRMLSEQKTDRNDTLAVSNRLALQNIHAMSMAGNDKGAEAALKSLQQNVDAAAGRRDIGKDDAQSATDSGRQTLKSGQMSREATKAAAEHRLPQFMKDLAENKFNIPDKDHAAVYHNVLSTINEQESLRAQDEALSLAKFNTLLAQDINSAPQALANLKNTVTETEYQKAQLKYLNALHSDQQSTANIQQISQGWGNPESFAHFTDKAVNKSFDLFTEKYQQQNPSVSHDDAQVIVAASAGGKIPVFTETLKNKIRSGNPAMMDSAGNQVDELRSMNAGHALTGLNEQDKTISAQYKSLRDSLPPIEAAKIAIQNANQDADQIKANKESLYNYMKVTTGNFVTAPGDYALKNIAEFSKDDFINTGVANAYGNFIYDKFSTYYQMTNRDADLATKLTKQDVKENFGDTRINGGKTKTLHPLEKVLGYEDNHTVVPFIQQDVMRKLNEKFMPLKEDFHARSEYVSKPGMEHFKANEYWDIVPNENMGKPAIYENYKPIQVKHYKREGNTVSSKVYDVVLIGNSFNWDVSLSTDSGVRPMMQLAPYLGVHTYTPDKKYIDSQYLNAHTKKAK